MHVLRPALWLCLLMGAPACYQQPEIPRDKPLSCASSDPAECPTGFVCIENRICAPEECELTEECPVGLVCGRMGCAVPGAADAGVQDSGNGAGGDS